jgi:hypothetical protein
MEVMFPLFVAKSGMACVFAVISTSPFRNRIYSASFSICIIFSMAVRLKRTDFLLYKFQITEKIKPNQSDQGSLLCSIPQ